MATDLKDIQNSYPFLSLITVAKDEYVGIIQNSDNKVLSIYVYELLPQELKSLFLEYGANWWWESNRMIPISIFMRDEMSKFKNIIMIMATKDVRVVIGPCTNLNSLAMKRTKRKSVQLVRKPK